MVLSCPICNKKFNCAPSRLKKAQNPPCCSRECASIQKQNKTELNCRCDYCGKVFHRKPSHILKNNNYNYCSRECLGKHRQEIYVGENNPNAFCRIPVGNKRIHCGYYWIYLPDHPLSTKDGYIREHRYIAEQYLLTTENSIEIDGQLYLSPEYDVHHKDLNKLNNEISNLEIMTRSEHIKLHGEIRREAMRLYKDKHNL